MFMSRLSLLIIILLATISCTGQEGDFLAESWGDVQEFDGGNITVLYVASEGFSYVNEDGDLTGVTIELMRDFARYVEAEHNVNLNIHFEAIESFSGFYDTVVNAKPGVFGVANVTITEERKEELAFSPSYLNNIAVLITHDSVSEIDDMEEIPEAFNGLTGLAFEGTLHEERIRDILQSYLPNSEIEMAHSNAEIIEKTAEEENYFAYVDIYNFWRATDQSAPLVRHRVGDELAEEFGVIMPRGVEWEDVINEFFDHDGGYVHSETYRDHLRDHLGDELAELLIGQL